MRRDVCRWRIRGRHQRGCATNGSYGTQPRSTGYKGICAFVYSDAVSDGNGTPYSFGAAWTRESIVLTEQGARSELVNAAHGKQFYFNPSHRYVFVKASGCGFMHGAVAGKIKKGNGQALGNDVYDVGFREPCWKYQ